MRFTSLTNPADSVSFQEALANGLPKDPASLYVPESIPQLSGEDLDRLNGADPVEIGKVMLSPFVSDEIPEEDLEGIVREAVTFETPLVSVGDKKVLELFHGPTMAFKDVAARYMGSFMSYYNVQTGQESTVVVATTGDTGGSMARGLADMEGVDLVVVYPKNRISQLQQEQLRRVPANVHTVEVDGTFNDCLALTTAAFDNQELRDELNLTSANSINVGRLLPQTTYYAGLYSQLKGEAARVVVPTGNLGNLTAGILARAMGVPLPNFLAANNANDALTRYLNTNGYYIPAETISTRSNAMDVNDPRNKPRLDWLFDGDITRMRDVVQAARVSDDETKNTIKRVYKETGYLLDPHTAVAWHASEVVKNHHGQTDVIISTASPVKFAQEIFTAADIVVDDSEALAELRKTPERYTEIDGVEEFTEFLRGIKSSAGSL
jgi:threonine synthase